MERSEILTNVIFLELDKKYAIAETTLIKTLNNLIPGDKSIRIGDKVTTPEGYEFNIIDISLKMLERTFENNVGMNKGYGLDNNEFNPYNFIVTVTVENVGKKKPRRTGAKL